METTKKWGEQPCWTCQRSAAKPPIQCSWDKNLTPIEGWTAEEVDEYKYPNDMRRAEDRRGKQAYKIYECPMYLKEESTAPQIKRGKQLDVKKALELHQQGFTDRQIAFEMKVDTFAIAKWRNTYGLPPRRRKKVKIV